MNVTCFGGPNDGEIVDVKEGRLYVAFAEMPKFNLRMTTDTNYSDVVIQQYVYDIDWYTRKAYYRGER